MRQSHAGDMRSEGGEFAVTRCASENEKEEVEQWMLLERESKGLNGELKATTIMAWLNRVLRDRRDIGSSPQVVFECFLISYQRLVTPVHLLKLLQKISEDPTRHLKLAVLDFLKYWLSAPDLTSSFSLEVSTFVERLEKELGESHTPNFQATKSAPSIRTPPKSSKRASWKLKPIGLPGKGSPIPTLKDECGITFKLPSTPPTPVRKGSTKKQKGKYSQSPPSPRNMSILAKNPNRPDWVMDSPDLGASSYVCRGTPSDPSWESIPALSDSPLSRTESEKSYPPFLSDPAYSRPKPDRELSFPPSDSVFGSKRSRTSLKPPQNYKPPTTSSLPLISSTSPCNSRKKSPVATNSGPLCPIFPSYDSPTRTRAIVKKSTRSLDTESDLMSQARRRGNSVCSPFPIPQLHISSPSELSTLPVFSFPSSSPEPLILPRNAENQEEQKQPSPQQEEGEEKKEEGEEEEEEEERTGQQRDGAAVVGDSEEKGNEEVCVKNEEGQKEKKSPLFCRSPPGTPLKKKKFEELPGGMSVKDLVAAFNMYDWEMYCFLEIREFCSGAWTKDKSKAPFLNQFSKTFDQASRWVSRCVLDDEKNFRYMFEYFVEVAAKLKKSKNLFRCLSIFSGLAHHVVARVIEKTVLLDQTSEVAKAYGKISLLFDARNEHRGYRKYFKKLEEQQRVIPYLPVHLRDLIYFEEQEAVIGGTTMLNMETIQKVYETILSILQFQDASLDGEEERMSFLKGSKREYLKKTVFQEHSVEDLYALSYAIKPKKKKVEEGQEGEGPSRDPLSVKRAKSDLGGGKWK